MKKWIFNSCLFFCLTCMAHAADLPEGGIPLSPSDTVTSFKLGGALSSAAQVETVIVSDAPESSGLKQALRIKTNQKATLPWEIQFQAKTIAPVRYGDTLLASLWLRGKSATGGKATVSFGLEQAGPPWVGTGWTTLSIGPNWQRYDIPMTASDNFAAGQMQMNLRFGYAPQEVEFGNIRVVNLQRTTSVLKLERQLNPVKKTTADPPLGRNLPFWAPEKSSIPALRKQLSLNGTWEFTPEGQRKNEIPVPEYWDAAPGFNCDQAIYERTVNVPVDWTGQRIMVEFESINHIADVYVDDQHVGSHIGGWTSFRCDITRYAKPGQSFRLKVAVKGGSLSPAVDEIDKPLWPMGWDGMISRWGIIAPVWLRAYGDVNISDARIVTSYRQKQIEVTYTIQNTTERARAISIESTATSTKSGTKFTLNPVHATLAPGQTLAITTTTSWSDPELWMPDQPNLYHLASNIIESGNVIDTQTQRIGFREIWIEKNYYMLNGVRVNLIGTSMHSQGEGYSGPRYQLMWPDNWPQTLDKLFGMNIRVIRFHQQPVPQWVLDVADEKGMLIIDESAVYARNMRGVDRDNYLANARTWIEQWVKDRRNHPSVIMWSAENECGDLVFKFFSNKQLKTLGDVIHKYDGTRPVVYDGDGDAGDPTISYHYPEGGDKVNLKGSIYQFGKLIRPDRPVSIGEFMFDYGRDKTRSIMQGTMTRGLRYSGFADIRPYTLFWTMDRGNEPIVAYIWKSLASVAVFDREYDDSAALELLLQDKLPVLAAGSSTRRTLLVYNDTYRDAAVEVKVELRAGDQTLATSTRQIDVAHGFHREIACEFTTPANPARMELVLSAYKNGAKMFEESRPFAIEGTAQNSGDVQLKLIDLQ